MNCKYLIIIICLLIILYLYNKNLVYEKVEHFDDNVINQIASIANGEKVVLKNVDITGTLNAPNINITGTLNAPNINTYQVNSTHQDKWIDFKGKPVFYEDAKFSDDKHTLLAPKITTRELSSTKKDGDYINFNTSIYSPKDNLLGTISSGHEGSKRTKIYFNNDVEFNKDKTLKVKNIQTNNIKAGYTEWVNFPNKVDLQSTFRLRGDDIKGTTKVMAGKQSWLTW